MNFFIFYFSSFILSYLGFLLGKSTTEEHIEIKKIVNKFLEILMFIFYSILFFLFLKKSFDFLSLDETTLTSSYDNLIIIFILISFGFYIFSLENKKKFFLEFHQILIYSISFIFLNKFFEEYLFLVLIPISYLICKNSFEKFNLKEEIYKIIIITIIFLILNIFLL